MLKYFVISRSEAVASAIQKGVEALYVRSGECVRSVLIDGEDSDEEKLNSFQRASDKIEEEICKHDLVNDRFIGILDEETKDGIEAVDSLSSVFGMLVLAFPEIQWVPIFKGADFWSEPTNDVTMSLDRAVKLCRGGHTPLFDGDGLRSILLEKAHGNQHLQVDKMQYYRNDIAYAIDEENHFSYLNAYTAYRFGYRAFSITTGECMEELLGVGKFPLSAGNVEDLKKTGGRGRTTVVFEDVCLEFPDWNEGKIKKMFFGEGRDKAFPKLKEADLRVLITAAQKEEKVARRGGKIITIEQYFSGGEKKRFKRIDEGGVARRKRHWCNTLMRKLRNLFGQWWIGYWLPNLMIVVLVVAGLIATFLNHTNYFWPAVIGVFLIFGWWRNTINDVIKNRTGHVAWFRKFFLKRQQWYFLPKCYHHYYFRKEIYKHEKTYWEIAHKPIAGIFGLRNKCELPNGSGFMGIYSHEDIKKLYDNAKRTAIFTLDGKEKDGSGHAAPGVVLELATRLLRRAERMKENIINVEGAIHGAVLANTAYELLNYKTSALCIEALYWKHYYEVLAECEFVGVLAKLDMEDRYIDIHNSMGRICCTESGIIRGEVFTSGMVEIVDNLAKLLKEKNKLEEALFFTAKSRMLHRRLLKPFLRNLLLYPEWVLRSGVNLGVSLGGFFLIFLLFFLKNSDDVFSISMIMYNVKKTYMIVTGHDQAAEFIVALARQIGLLHLTFIGAYFVGFLQRK